MNIAQKLFQHLEKFMKILLNWNLCKIILYKYDKINNFLLTRIH